MQSLRGALEAHQRFTNSPEPETRPFMSRSKRLGPAPRGTDHMAEIFGQSVRGANLPDLFARCVDLIHELDPSAIERLANKKTHARRYVARRSQDIHIRSPHLETRETKSGWWISADVGKQQVTTAMRLLAEAASLTFGEDFIFPLTAADSLMAMRTNRPDV